MARIDDGGPAFPQPFIYDPDRGHAGQYIDAEDAGVSTGLTLRDYFATKALQGQIAYEGMEGCDAEHIAGMAYELADAMLAARRAEGGAG